MNRRIFFCLCVLSLAIAARAEKFSLVGATVINPADGKVLPNATVVINGDKIERVSMGKQDAAMLGKQIPCVGKFILPGYIDTHVHFFQSGDLFTRPDAVDLNSVRPYKDEIAWVKSHLDDCSRATFDAESPAWSMSADRCGISRCARSPARLRKRRASPSPGR